ncbi:hypothetical protein R5Q19_05545 [Oenococcus oeni]
MKKEDIELKILKFASDSESDDIVGKQKNLAKELGITYENLHREVEELTNKNYLEPDEWQIANDKPGIVDFKIGKITESGRLWLKNN